MALYFISDIHLRFGDDKTVERFCSFIETKIQAEDVLVLGGDLFDLFIGNKKIFRKQFAPALKALQGLAAKGTQVHYLEGNHDFHLEAVFGSSPNIVVHDRPFSVQAVGKKFWIAHGDEIDKEDYGYRLLRLITRSFTFRVLLSMMPDIVLAKIGVWSSRQSRKYNSVERLSDSSTLRTKTLFRDYARLYAESGHDVIFLGHSHLRDHLEIQAPKCRAEYLNLGFSSAKLLYARYSLGGDSLEIAAFPE